jgi:hypothetical protein
MPIYFPENNTPWQNDDVTRSLQKINALVQTIQSDVDNITLKATTAARSNFSAATDTQVAPASTTRASLSIFNVGPAILYIGQGSTAVTTTDFTYLLNAGDTYVANPNEVGLEHRGIFAVAGSNAEVTIGA